MLGLLFFLLGLLFLLVKNEDLLVFSFRAEGGDTKVTVTGSGPQKVPELLAAIGQSVKVDEGVPQLPAAQTPPAAWYPSPENPDQLRWWDGTQWTEHYAPVASSPTDAGSRTD